MLRILLIILVALAVIIGLMRLTGARPGDVAPAAAVGAAEPVEEAIEVAPAGEVVIDEPAVDSLDVPVDAGAEAPAETMEPGAATAEPETDNATSPATEPATEQAAEPAPGSQAPGR